MKRNAGFTLLEILVVVLIITILATIVGVQVAQQPGRARAAAAEAQMVIFRSALSSYRMHHGYYPTAAQGLQALVRPPSRPPIPESYPDEGYMESRNLPSDPWKRPFIYVVPGPDGARYDVVTYGADGEPGGEGEAADIRLSDR